MRTHTHTHTGICNLKSLRVVEGCCHAPSCYTAAYKFTYPRYCSHFDFPKESERKERVGGSKRKKDEPEKDRGDKTAEKSRRLRAGEIRIEGGERRVEGGKEE